MKDLEIKLRLVKKSGISLNGKLYWGEGLILWVGFAVMVRQWLNRADRISCFDPLTGKFICDAVKYSSAEPSAIQLKAAQKRARIRAERRAAELRKLVSAKP
jgi:hypothetical protein